MKRGEIDSAPGRDSLCGRVGEWLSVFFTNVYRLQSDALNLLPEFVCRWMTSYIGRVSRQRLNAKNKGVRIMDRYEECLKALYPLIPSNEYKAVMAQDMCELEYDFLGFIDVYKPLSELIPKEKVVIDFGCYLAAQSYYFAEHKGYIGVDVVAMQRFTPRNAVHYTESIQEFLEKELPKLLEKHNERHFCAICSYVPDFEATALVRQTFSNVFCYNPSLE